MKKDMKLTYPVLGDGLDRYRKRLWTGKPFPKQYLTEKIADSQGKISNKRVRDQNGKYVLKESKFEEIFQLMRTINQFLRQGNNRATIAEWLQTQNGYSHLNTGYKVISDTIAVFGDINKSDKEGEKYLILVALERIAAKCVLEGDYQTELKVLEMRAKLLAFEEGVQIDPRLLMQPVPVTFTTNPSALGKAEDDNEFDDFEEMQEEEEGDNE